MTHPDHAGNLASLEALARLYLARGEQVPRQLVEAIDDIEVSMLADREAKA